MVGAAQSGAARSLASAVARPRPAPAPAVPATRPRTEGDWFLLPAPRPAAQVRLFCFPHAGGDATAFTPLARHLAPAAEVWALRPPGPRGRRRAPVGGGRGGRPGGGPQLLVDGARDRRVGAAVLG
ncbi:thioesterase domain-containing protein, partial [Kitasatospora sp. NPDC059463]|uniref:thioesterase domain-containing protein n=1 Tax=Kitasatospora sp. NPDC059463 TaxID=3346842 RepID=UPI0036C56608